MIVAVDDHPRAAVSAALQSLYPCPARYLRGADMAVLAAAAVPLPVAQHHVDPVDLGVETESRLKRGPIHHGCVSRCAARAKISGSAS